MSGRPEGDSPDGQVYDDYDREAWQQFTDWRPWRPGDPSPTDEAPSYTAREYVNDRAGWAGDRDKPQNWGGQRRSRGAGQPARAGVD